ncbi:hypothetical protein V501_07981 [Pseudogymnoascus sp. VKM F-4519 (FW-2642)]|nr:hypothetical protein V501_07981 [Pseudogymnoascus sp. VKM F-4519 (FW-2642)]
MPPKMPSLVVPRSGLPLEVGAQSGAASNGLIGLTLTDTLIEEMINCVQSGEAIQFSLGPDSSISYGSKTHQLTSTEDPFSYDIFQNHKASTGSPTNLDSAMANPAPRGPGKSASRGLWNLGSLTKNYTNIRTEMVDARGRTVKQKANDKVAKTSPKLKEPTQGSDDALETLRNTMAMENAKKSASTTQLVKDSSALPPPVQKRGSAAPLKVGSSNSFASKRALGKSNMRSSLPTSPALNAISSPSLGATSIPASQQQAEKTKAIRGPIIHRLALGPATMSELEKLRTSAVTPIEYKHAIEKVADEEDGKFKLTRKFFRELDVWKHDYESDAQRQTAIENAIHVYDRLRLNPSEPEWQMLLPVAERGTGKCLSRIQAKIAVSGNFGAKTKPKTSEDSSRESAGEDGDKAAKPAKSAGMSRSTSQNSATKSKAAKDREAQDKRLSGKSSAAKPAPKKVAPPKKQAKTTSKTTFKSAQFVSDSEEEADDYMNHASTTSNKGSPTKKTPVDKQNDVKSNKRKSDALDTVEATNGTAKKAKKAPSTSSSGLSSVPSSKHHVSDSSQSTHDVKTLQRSINNSRAKMNTSPQKSSPLASSPPTNASDMEDLDQSTSISPSSSSTDSIKRRAVDSEFDEPPKKKRPSGRNGATDAEMKSIYNRNQFRHVPTHCMDASARFQTVYDRYLKLYQELQADPSRLLNEHRKLMDLHDRVAQMKREIIESARDKSEDR